MLAPWGDKRLLGSIMYSKNVLFVAMALAPLAVAQAAPTRSIETLIVIGQKGQADDVHLAGSVDLLTRDELAYEHVDDTLELFNKIPGVYFARFNQGIINTDIAIRGFAGEGSTPHAKLLIDGIPSNLHNGYGELDQLFPRAIESIEVFKGTSDARYGLFNLAGNYRVTTRRDVDVTEISLAVGSFDSYEASGYWGLQQGEVTHNYFAGFRSSRGYREHNDLDKYSLSGRWQWQPTPESAVTAIARMAGYDGNAPGYLDDEQARQNPRRSAPYANQDGGEKTTQHLSLHWDHNLRTDLAWALKAYAQNFERERWLRFTEGSALQNRYDDQDQVGFLSTLRWQFAPDWRLDWGLDAEFQEVVEQRFGTQGQVRVRDPNNVIRNFEYQFDTRGSYLLLEQQVNDVVTWNAAVRADQLRGDFVQYNAEGEALPRDMYDFGTIVQPKLNVLVAPMDNLTLFANYGRSFQHPFSANAYTAENTGARDVSINDGWESGAHWSYQGLGARLSYWQQKAKREFVLVDGEAQNVGETDRYGWDLALHWYLTPDLYLWANYATANTEIVTPSDTQPELRGNELRGIPRYTASLGINYHFTQAITSRLHWYAQGDAYVNELNLGGRFGGFNLLNLHFDYEQPWGGLSLQVNNVLDEYYAYVYDLAGDGTGLIHSPGDGINGTVALTYRF